MSNNNPQAVQAHLERIVQAGTNLSDQRLEFDKTTGQLMLQTKNTPIDPDTVVADQTAEDGYFIRN
jgi:hypothetical protein